MEALEAFFRSLADFLWGNWLLFVLVGLGVYYTFLTGWVQLRHLPFICKNFLKQLKGQKESEGGGLSSFQALCTAIASCVGSGNIVGVSTAILAGGPGAMFWMWFAAFFGMATKFGEIVLGICYRERDEKGSFVGGPMYYIAKGLHAPWLGCVAALLLFVQNAGGTLIQSNTISSVARDAFHLPPFITGLAVAALMTLIISGGFKRLVLVAERVVPFMAGLYVVGGLVVILSHSAQIPTLFREIFEGAFSAQAGLGAVAGLSVKEAMRYGVARGLYSNEAGEGSAAVLHSAARVDHPVRQGLYGVIEVFVDTMVICTTTGFVVLITGVYQSGVNAANLSAAAFGTVMPFMSYVVSISLILFAATSLMSQWYFGHVSLTYLRCPKGAKLYRLMFPVLILFGSLSTIDLVWSVQDCALGLLILPNIAALLALSPKVRQLTREFFAPENGYLDR